MLDAGDSLPVVVYALVSSTVLAACRRTSSALRALRASGLLKRRRVTTGSLRAPEGAFAARLTGCVSAVVAPVSAPYVGCVRVGVSFCHIFFSGGRDSDSKAQKMQIINNHQQSLNH